MSRTYQRLINGDARDLSFLDDESIHLVVTSPPYWNLKQYNENPRQLGHIEDYEAFLVEIEKVWPLICDYLIASKFDIKMIRNIFPIGDIVRGPHMTYAEDGRFGVTVVMDPKGTSSMAFTSDGEGCGLGAPCSVEAPPVEAAENLQFSQVVDAHLDDVLVDFNARREMWGAK